MKPYNTGQSKKEEVRQMFDTIAPTYDRLNHMLSFNLDRGWRRRTVRMAARQNPYRILDMATGTGDLAFALARKIPGSQITGVDLSEGMLEIAVRKAQEKELSERVAFHCGDAENLAFPDNSFDCVTAGFGVRNFQDIPAGLRELCRVTDNGGCIYILEFSTPRNKIFGPLYRFYFHRVLPFVGKLVSKDGSAYKYLPESVDEFPEKHVFLQMLSDAGFADCQARTLMLGVAYIYSGRKLPDA